MSASQKKALYKLVTLNPKEYTQGEADKQHHNECVPKVHRSIDRWESIKSQFYIPPKGQHLDHRGFALTILGKILDKTGKGNMHTEYLLTQFAERLNSVVATLKR